MAQKNHQQKLVRSLWSFSSNSQIVDCFRFEHVYYFSNQTMETKSWNLRQNLHPDHPLYRHLQIFRHFRKVFDIELWSNCSDEDITPHIIEWRETAGGIFGLGTNKWTSSVISTLDTLQIDSYGLYLDLSLPRLDFNHFSGNLNSLFF